MNNRNKQAGYTLTELLIAISGIGVLAFIAFLVWAAIYAIGKYLFGWW